MNLRFLPGRSAFSIGLSLAIGLVATATPAHALKFTKLLESGQTVPGSSQPVELIGEATIGLDGQVAVRLSTNPTTPPGIYPSEQFYGIYSIAKSGNIRLVAGEKTLSYADPTSAKNKYVGFTRPDISQGKIAYISATRVGQNPPKMTLYVGQPGQVKPILDFAPSTKFRAYPNRIVENLAFVNGKAYVLVSTGDKLGLVGVVDTEAAKPQLNVLNIDEANASVSANSQQVLTTTVTQVYNGTFPPDYSSFSCTVSQSLGGGNFKLLATAQECGAAVSAGNAVYYTVNTDNNQPPKYYHEPKINVRFGQNGQFTPIPLPNDPLKIYPNTIQISGVSISQQSVIFVASVGPFDTPRYLKSHVDTLYLSQNGQAPKAIIAAGQTLDGKTVSFLGIGSSRRRPGDVGSTHALAGNSAVFTVTFSDNTTALYRVDL
jgi:hypothetical protein